MNNQDHEAVVHTQTDVETPAAPPEAKRGVFAAVISGFSARFPDDFDARQGRAGALTIAWPALVESFLLQLASMVNTMMVGGLGAWAIASVGYCNQPRLLIMAVFQAFNVGATALIARAKGSGDVEGANTIMHQAILFSLTASVALAALGYIFATPLLVLMGANEAATIEGGTQYFQIIMLTFPANAVSLAITAGLRGIGVTRVAMIYNVTANAVNIALGYVLIQGRFGFPALGVRGAAIGMGAGQVIAALIALVTLMRGADMLKFSFRHFLKADIAVLRRIAKISAPAMIEQLCFRVGNLVFTRIIASLGTAAFAAHHIIMNIYLMSFMNGQAFGIAATSLIGQSIGRKRPDHGKASVHLCRRYSFLLSVAMAALLVIAGRQIVGLYTDDAGVVMSAAALLWIVAVLQPLQSSNQVLAGALRGAGDTKGVAISTFIGLVIMRPVLSWVFVYMAGIGLAGVWLALLADQTARSLYTVWRFASEKWKTAP